MIPLYERRCGTCYFMDIDLDQEPCGTCFGFLAWQPVIEWGQRTDRAGRIGSTPWVSV